MPWVSSAVVKVASPVGATCAVKRVVVPSRRDTVPVGWPAVVLAMWVVRVMGRPGSVVVAEAVRVVSVGAGEIVRFAGDGVRV